jgi:hypothetical protein
MKREPKMTANLQQNVSVFKRVLLLYGAYMLLNNCAYLIGFYILPEGFMRGSPQTVAARIVNSAGSFGMELALTLVFNLGMVALLAILLNANQVNGFPTGYVYPLFLGVIGGLVAGTNSFVASDLTKYTVWEGMALSLSIGNFEMLGYISVIAATVKLGIYQSKSWWRWTGKWKPIKTGRLQDVRLDRYEAAVLIVGIALVLFAAYRETLMAWGML